jgi:ATP-dependent Clp protease ATP-binding subunit ClpC
VLELALRSALALGHNYIGTEHILLGVLEEGEDPAARALIELGVTTELTQEWLLAALERITLAKRLAAVERITAAKNKTG